MNYLYALPVVYLFILARNKLHLFLVINLHDDHYMTSIRTMPLKLTGMTFVTFT